MLDTVISAEYNSDKTAAPALMKQVASGTGRYPRVNDKSWKKDLGKTVEACYKLYKVGDILNNIIVFYKLDSQGF